MAVALRRKIEAKTMRVLGFGWLLQSRLSVNIIFDTQPERRAKMKATDRFRVDHSKTPNGVALSQPRPSA
jgi:hypothetical protein